MTLCPIAIVASCKKCLVVSVCPLKSFVGDFEPAGKKNSSKKKAKSSSGAATAKKKKRV